MSILCSFHYLQFNYLAAPANNLNVNLVHHQQKSFASHPYSDFYYETYKNSNNPNSTMRSVKNYRKPQAPTGACLQLPSNENYNMFLNNSSNSSSLQDKSTIINSNNNFNYQKSSSHNKCNNNSVSSNKYLPNDELMNQSSNINANNISNLSRRSSQSSGSHDWPNEKSSLSLCINRINLKKSSKSPTTSSGGQFQSMRCRRHRNRNHFFNTSTSSSYQKYKLTKSCSNDTDISDQQNEVEKIPNTYKFV